MSEHLPEDLTTALERYVQQRIATGSSPVAPPSTAPELELPATWPVDLPAVLARVEDAFISRALDAAGGNRAKASLLLGLGRTTLVEKLRRRHARGLPLTPWGGETEWASEE